MVESGNVLNSNWLLASFSRSKATAVKLYREFVSEGRKQPSPWEKIRNQIYLGDDNFVDEMQCKISPDMNLSEIPSSQRRPVAKSLSYYEKISETRDEAIKKAYRSGGHSMKEVGIYFGLHYSRVSRIINAKDKT